MLKNDSKRLTNEADRIFVIAHIASYLPRKQSNNSDALFKFAEDLTDGLKSIEDQFGRYYLLARLISKKEQREGFINSKKIIRKDYSSNQRTSKCCNGKSTS